jgi:hypothetical protein
VRRFALIATVALVSAGCIGSAGTSHSPSSEQTTQPKPLVTDLTVTYFLPTCPPGARCILASTVWGKFRRVTRHLSCSPSSGDYPDPAAACKALADVVTKFNPQTWLFGCRPDRPPARAVGVYQGKRRIIPLDGCNLAGIDVDLAQLLPDA